MRRSSLLAVFVTALVACSPAETPARPRESLRTAAARVPVTPRPTRDAKVIDGVHSVVLAPGFGRVKPALGQRTLLVISYLAYDERGVFKSETPVALQELDVAPAEWRGVLGDMVAGEKRRVWAPHGEGFRLYDLELQSIGQSGAD